MKFLEVADLKTYYFARERIVKAVDGVSFEVHKMKALGIAGESACGKTTLGLSILRLLPPNAEIVSGKILLEGDDLKAKSESSLREIRGKQISMVFQGAMNSLNPVRKVGEQIAEAIMAHEKINKSHALDRAAQLFAEVGIDPSRIYAYPHQFSGGMRQRVMMAIALACNPKLVIADEPTTGVDVMTQATLLKLIKELQKKRGISIMLITHDLSIIAKICDELAIMYAGKIIERSDVTSIFSKMLHPYTRLLIQSIPSIRGRRQLLRSIPGAPPDLTDPPPGCRFHPRCPYVKEICRLKEPVLEEPEKGHHVACHFGNIFLEGKNYGTR